MSDTAYKTKSLLGLDPAYPAIGGLAPLTRSRWQPLAALFRAQDTVPATSRRIVCSVDLSGAAEWAQPGGTDDPGGGAGDVQRYPTNAWRTVASNRVHLTPGCELRAHLLFCPSGLVVKEIAGDWVSDGAWAEFRVGVTWVNGASSTGPHYSSVTMPGSQTGTYTGAELTADGANWSALDEREILGIRPPGYDATPATAAAYSEWTDARIVLQVRGGARVVEAIVFEHPLAHVTAHNNAGLTSVHAMPPGSNPQIPRPMTKAVNGTTYNENRFGTLRMMQVAERQSERLGPRVLHWSSYNESTHDPLTDTENDPITIASSSYVDVLDSSITSYSLSNPGHVVAGAHAQLQRLGGPFISGGRYGVVPCRVRVDASQSSNSGTVRVQAGLYEWIDVTIVATARGVFEATGFLQCQATPDDPAPPLVVFGSSGSGARTLSIWNVSIDFGTW